MVKKLNSIFVNSSTTDTPKERSTMTRVLSSVSNAQILAIALFAHENEERST